VLIEEAKWFGARISELGAANICPMLNIGSSTETFRTHDQPWIDRHIFKPIRDAGGRVVHIDIKDAPGVDLVGDLADPVIARRIAEIGIKSTFCSNLLEHVIDRDAMCRAIDAVVPPGGYIFLSCPYRYPLHLDPIDTMFRPDVQALAALFPGTEFVRGDVVVDATYLDYVGRSPASIAKRLVRLMVPAYKPKQWYTSLHHLPWAFRRFEASCAVLRKPL
jgi:hypothetical protein